jgi:predicted amidohydrolase
MDEIAAVSRGAPQIGRCLINIARTGVAPGGELQDLTRANVDLARVAIARNRDVVIGVKARMSNNKGITARGGAPRRRQLRHRWRGRGAGRLSRFPYT